MSTGRPRFVTSHAAGGGVMVAGCLVFALASCGDSAVSVTPARPVDADTARQCTALLDTLPDTVAGEDARGVEPADALAAAWGDPPIVLRCGVRPPAALRPAPACFVVNGVGWLATQDGAEVSGDEPVRGALTWTTVGRAAYVEVVVPADPNREAVAPLPDLAGAVKKAIPRVSQCQ